MTSRPDLKPILDALRAARAAAEEAYQSTPPGWERIALAGVVDDLADPIAAMRDLVDGRGAA